MAEKIKGRVFDPERESRDLGFGSLLAERRDVRMLNRDGTFNVERPAEQGLHRYFSYHTLITISWPSFFALVTLGYVLLNLLFAAAFLACGEAGLRGGDEMSRFARAFFFSIHTFATVGYGNVVPANTGTNLLVAVESLVGLLSLAFATGLLFARFSRPVAEIIYSHKAVIAPYRGISAFMFRTLNGRENQLIDVQARVILARFETIEGQRRRVFHQLELERKQVAFFPLSWTVVHPIDETSAMFGWTEVQMKDAGAEFLILITATDETFAQAVHSRSSYTIEEMVWGARFKPAIDEGAAHLDLERFHSYERVAVP